MTDNLEKNNKPFHALPKPQQQQQQQLERALSLSKDARDVGLEVALAANSLQPLAGQILEHLESQPEDTRKALEHKSLEHFAAVMMSVLPLIERAGYGVVERMDAIEEELPDFAAERMQEVRCDD